MEIELIYTSNRRGGIEMVKRQKKMPTLPNIGDAWQQAGWLCIVDGRVWTESMDKVTILLASPSDVTASDLRQMVDDLAEAGWADSVDSPRG
jgi:hypothetical protein